MNFKNRWYSQVSGLLPVIFLFMLLVAACIPMNDQPAEPVPTATQAPPNTPAPSPLPGDEDLPEPAPAGEEGFCEALRLPEGFPVIGYLPEYRPFDIIQANCLSDLIFFSLEPTVDGHLDTSRVASSRIEAIRAAKEKYGVRLHLSLGGWGRNGGFAEMVIDPARRQLFISELTAFLEANDFDGVDYDWEFPETPEEKAGYGALITETRLAIVSRGGMVSVALYPHQELDITPYLTADRIHLMSYDRGKRHSTYDQAVADVDYFLSLGVPPEKLILGLPFYGRLIEPPFTPHPYLDIVQQYNPPGDLDEMDGIFYNGQATIRQKTCYALQKGIGGVMVWELGHDVQPGSPQADASLMRVIHQAVTGRCQGQ
jgi:chitinase